MKTVNLKPNPCRIKYTMIDQDGKLGLRLEEYQNNLLTKEKDFYPLTGDRVEIERLIRILKEENVYIIHAKEILEELGFPV